MSTRPAAAVLAMATVLRLACSQPAWAVSANSTILLSRPSGLGALPVPGDGFAFLATKAMSGDGRFVVFASAADDLGVRDARNHVWVRDTVSGTTTLVDRVPGGGAPGNGNALLAGISRDGSTVCFLSAATNLVAGTTGSHVYVATLATGALVVADRTSGAAGAIGDASAQRCGLDATGTRVVFDSAAANLVASDSNNAVDVFVRDLGTASTTRVSVDPMGAQSLNGGRVGAISADGASVVFESASALVPGDSDNFNDIYVRNTQANTTVRASVGTGGVPPDGRSFDGAIDDTGTHVAFSSDATNLDLGVDDNGVRDIFWRALVSDTTILVSRASGGAGALANGASFLPAISGDGVGVAFQTTATNLAAEAPPPRTSWVYLRRLGTDVTSLLSRASGVDGAPADRAAARVSLGDTPIVAAAWSSDASNLDPDASGEFTQVFKRDLSGTALTTLVSRPIGTGSRNADVNDSGLAAVETSGAQTISADGRFVAFVSVADGIDPAAGGRFSQVFVRDNVADTTTLVSRGPGSTGAVGNGDALEAAIAAGGTHVVFFSLATNLLPGVTSPAIYVRHLATGVLEEVTRFDGPPGSPLAVGLGTPDISADGRRVAFTASDALVPADTNAARDAYVRDLDSGTTTLVSVGASGGAGDDNSGAWSMSDDATRVAFESDATNLLATGPVSGRHLYVRDLLAGTTTVLDRDPQTGEPSTANPRSPEISGTGNRVAFYARQALTTEAIPSNGAIYVRDLTAEVTLLVSREDGADGAAADVDDEVPPSIDHDGTRVGWSGSAAALPGGADTLHVYLRDLSAGTTLLVSAVNGTAATAGNSRASNVALDAVGSCVAFDSTADDLTVPAYPTQDFRQTYLRAVDDGCLPTVTATTSTTSTTLPPGSGNPIPAKTLVLRPGKLLKLVAKGLSAPPVTSVDPTRGGGSLSVSGTTGSVSFALPASGWKAVGRRKPKGFKFKGAECRVTLLQRRLKAACGVTGALQLPEPGPLEVVLVVEQEAYCAECGGRLAGRPEKVFKRKACPAPATCP